MSEQPEQVTTTPQKDEVSKDQTSEAEAVTEKVVAVESDNGKDNVAEAKPEETVEQAEVSSADDNKEAKAAGEEHDSEKKVDPEVDQPAAEANGDKVDDSNGHDQVANGKAEESTEKIEESKPEESVVEETNGVCKRKAENGAEAADEETTPKKAKTLEQDGDKAPVEETAA